MNETAFERLRHLCPDHRSDRRPDRRRSAHSYDSTYTACLFADTFGVFEDPNALTLDQLVSGEERHVTIGMDVFGRVLVVVYTWRGDNIRIISARKAVRSEVRQYESEL